MLFLGSQSGKHQTSGYVTLWLVKMIRHWMLYTTDTSVYYSKEDVPISGLDVIKCMPQMDTQYCVNLPCWMRDEFCMAIGYVLDIAALGNKCEKLFD